MLHLLADYTYNYTTTTSSGSSGLSTGVLLALCAVALVFAVFIIAAMWKVFTKAGKPGWAAIIPIYNTWVLAEIIGKPGWWGLYPLVGIVPIIGPIVSIVISIIFALGLAKSFGKSVVFAIFGLVIFGVVGYPILGFGSARYLGPNGEAGPLPPTAPGPDHGERFNPVQPAQPAAPTPRADGPSPAPQAQPEGQDQDTQPPQQPIS